MRLRNQEKKKEIRLEIVVLVFVPFSHGTSLLKHYEIDIDGWTEQTNLGIFRQSADCEIASHDELSFQRPKKLTLWAANNANPF